MKRLQLVSRCCTGLLGLCILMALSTGSAQAIDWNKVSSKDVALFYPGQASWEWVLTIANHSGATKFRGGKTCRGCHEGEHARIGDLIVSGQKLDPAPYPYETGSVVVNVKTAHDDENFYVRLEWASDSSAGEMLDKDFEAKVTFMFDDGNVVEAARAGCWGTCHDDADGMASATDGQSRKKYLSRSRTKNTRQGGGDTFKADADIQSLYDSGTFLEYWQARLNKGAAAVAVDGYLLKDRQENANPLVQVSADNENGKWVVVMSRKLIAGAPGHKDLVAGTPYNFGIAIHGARSAGRYHRVSFEQTLMLDAGAADFIAERQ